MWVRIQELSFEPSRADAVVRYLRDTAVSRYEGDGYRGFRLLLDRVNGRALDVSYWEGSTGAHSDLARGSTDSMRAMGATAGVTNYYELAIDAG
jgi:hypothetical protein